MRPPNPRVTGDDVFNDFKSSLEACLSDHQQCKKPSGQLPTRLLLLDDEAPERVFVRESQLGEMGNYVALSYCWGTTSQTKLLKSNFDDFSEQGIDIGSLPKTIEDSIIATRRLGFKSLWIDSLCIIQDSVEDKDKEIVRMASIYKNATITISAAAATNCGQGFLEDRPGVQFRLDQSIRLPFLTTSDEGTQGVIDWVYICPDSRMGHKVKLFSEEVISRRAWTYQESTLEPRLLIYGSGSPQWHCKEKWSICGLDVHPDKLPPQECSSGTMKITVQDGSIVPDQTLRYLERPEPRKDEIGLWLPWFPLLENYSHRALSYRTDKLLAMSALAAEHQASQSGTYAAGLWSASLPRSLLWRSSNSRDAAVDAQKQAHHPLHWLRTRIFDTLSSMETGDPSTQSDQYVAPTWSPMSSTDPIGFESTATQQEDEYHTSLVKINNIHLQLKNDLNAFGQLNFSYLDLTAPMRSMSWKELTATFVIMATGEPFKYWDFIIPDNPAFFEEMAAKYESSLNPQVLADTNMQEDIDEGDCSILIGDEGQMRISLPVIWEPASRECADVSELFANISDVKQTVIDSLLPKFPAPKLPGQTHFGKGKIRERMKRFLHPRRSNSNNTIFETESGDSEFWLLEVERSMCPAGLVLRQVKDDVFARVGYFGMNRATDPEIVYLPGRVQVRGRRGGPRGENDWYNTPEKRRIYLI